MSVPGVDVGRVSAVLTRLLETGKPVAALDHTTGEFVPVGPQLAAAPHGFLPLFLAAADTVWRDATGRSLGIELQRDPQTVLGHRAHAITSPAFTPVMLSMIEAMAQASRPDMLVVNDLHAPWLAAQERLQWREQLAVSAAPAAPAAEPRTSFGDMRP